MSNLRSAAEEPARGHIIRCEEENKMEKLMNKMDNMELDKVTGGKRYVYPDNRRPNRPIKEYHVERKQVIRYR
jgi:hypothetical protein